MKKMFIWIIGIILVFSISAQAKTYDLVLMHGLTNKHHWSDSFLSKAAEIWGSGNVYVVFSNSSTRVWTRTINGRLITFCGENDFTGGDGYVWDQSNLIDAKITKLKTSYGLSAKFNVVAHSMGGLVMRYYAWTHPNTVAGLVTLGTPHHGSSLANAADFLFLDWFLGADHAMEHLKPSWVNNYFNVNYPVSGMPMADSGRVYTITGDGDGWIWECWGWGGELFAGWPILLIAEGDNDGLVSHSASKITGATDIGTFWNYDHYDLVQQASVMVKAAAYLR